jgi:hypothetical protein
VTAGAGGAGGAGIEVLVVGGVFEVEQPTVRKQAAVRRANLRLPICTVVLDVGAIY